MVGGVSVMAFLVAASIPPGVVCNIMPASLLSPYAIHGLSSCVVVVVIVCMCVCVCVYSEGRGRGRCWV